MRLSVVRWFGLVVTVLVLSGCGPTYTSLSGKVTHQGKKVVIGNVSIVASDNISYPATIQEDGTYTIPNIPCGPCKIGVTSPNPEGISLPSSEGPPAKEIGMTVGGPPKGPKPAAGNWFELPDKYRDPLTSGLTGEIKKGQPLDVDVP